MMTWPLLLTLVSGVLCQQGKGPRTAPSTAADNSQLLEFGGPAKPSSAPKMPAQISIVSYNIRWRTGAELDRIAAWLKSKGVCLIALQEVDRAKQRTARVNNARALAEKLNLYYAWAAPPLPKDAPDKEEPTGVALLSPVPLTDITRLVLPHDGPGGRWRVALGATVKIGPANIRIYSVHSETRIPVSQKLDQYRAVLDDLAPFPKETPAIVMGDFNSWEPDTVEGVRRLFTQKGFATPFPDGETTFSRSAVLFDVKLKLDWIWLRGLPAKTYGIDRSLTVSDHFPLWTVVSEPPVAPAR